MKNKIIKLLSYFWMPLAVSLSAIVLIIFSVIIELNMPNQIDSEPVIILDSIKYEKPEMLMADGFDHFFTARECFENAVKAYQERNCEETADSINAVNVGNAIHYMARAYDELSAIWENDIQPNR
jgi:hypothetical protein